MVDAEKTREVFGHRDAGYRTGFKETQPSYEPAGTLIGIFVYRDKTYFDSFFRRFESDFNGSRAQDPILWRTLGVGLSESPAAAFFYVFTGLHALHVAGGIFAMARWAGPGTRIYWHFLTGLWVYLLVLVRVYMSGVAVC